MTGKDRREQLTGMEPTDHDLVAICGIAAEASEEMLRQLARWGRQHHPSVVPALVGDPTGAALHYEIPFEDVAQDRCDQRHNIEGTGTWADILIEEVAETIAAAATAMSGNVAVREELIQVAAVALSWARDLDDHADTGELDG